MPHYTAAINALRAAGIKPVPSHPVTNEGLLESGNIDLLRRPIVTNPDGSQSTVHSMGMVDENPQSPRYGREVLVPSVIPGPNGYYTDMQGDAARKRYYQSGERLGTFDSPEASSRYGQALHGLYESGAFGSQYPRK